jgi:hypothetical protein
MNRGHGYASWFSKSEDKRKDGRHRYQWRHHRDNVMGRVGEGDRVCVGGQLAKVGQGCGRRQGLKVNG